VFENSKVNLKVNDYCYVDFNEKLFDKSYDVKVDFMPFKTFKLISQNAV
jgi:hypothetical protein